MVEDNHIFKFLIRLNMEFDEVRGRIIGRHPLTSIGEVLSEVWREESHLLMMLDNKTPGKTIESFTLAAGSNAGWITNKKIVTRLLCGVTIVTNHVIHWRDVEKFMENLKTRRDCMKHGLIKHEKREVDSALFNKEQIDQLLKLSKANSVSSSAPNASVTQAGSIFKAFSCHSFINSTPWIIDLGASDHMNSMFNLFNSYFLCFGHEKILYNRWILFFYRLQRFDKSFKKYFP